MVRRKRGIIALSVLAAWALLSVIVMGITPASGQAVPATGPLGTNLTHLTDSSREWVFVDIFRYSRPWVSNRTGQPWGSGGPLNLTPEGWVASLQPGQYATALLLTAASYRPPDTQYVLLYDGEGSFRFGANSGTINSQSPGRIVFTLGTGGLLLDQTATNPANPARNIRIIPTAYESTYQTITFRPEFLERLRSSNYQAIRFMDWMRTNNQSIVSWNQRTTPASATQAGSRGVALEYMIELANTLDMNPWFTIPFHADDDYVRNFATMVRDRLDAGLTTYVEYSNEVWNCQFQQCIDSSAIGLNLGLSTNGYQAGLFYYSRRAVQIFRIWEQVFGGTDRLVRVLASQSANSWTGRQVITFENAYQYADVLAIAPYFGYTPNAAAAPTYAAMTVDELLTDAIQVVQNEANAIQLNRNLTNTYGLDLFAYEGGQHYVGVRGGENNTQLNVQFDALNRHPQMRCLYTQYLNQWAQITGGGLFMHYLHVGSFSKFGRWGALEYQNQPNADAPKYQALLEYAGVDPGVPSPCAMTPTPTPTATATSSQMATATGTTAATATTTATPTGTIAATATGTQTATGTHTATATGTHTATATGTQTATATGTHTATATGTTAATATGTQTATATGTHTATATYTPVPSQTGAGSVPFVGQITLQGRMNSGVGMNTPVTIELYQANVLVYQFTPTPNNAGAFSINGIAPGTYRVWVKHAQHLAVLHDSVVISAGIPVMNLGMLRAGDANNDNVVSLNDFSLLAGTFNRALGDAGYDARADFNGDNAVTLNDFSLLAAGYAQTGAVRPS